MRPGLRKVALTAHVVCSVGWLGAVGAFLGLAVLALTAGDGPTARGAYLVMHPAAWLVLVPLALASLLTGLVQSLGTEWGLIRHYWVVFKLAINVVATLLLLLYTRTLAELADLAAPAGADVGELRSASVVVHAAAALLLLLVATFLGVAKPRGLTPYGRRARRRALAARARGPRSARGSR